MSSSSSVHSARGMKRNVVLLSVCQAFMMSGNTLLITATALVGLGIAPQPEWATVPFALMFGGLILTTYPASLLMQRLGRRVGFTLGAFLGILGGCLSAWAVVQESFWTFCIGSMLLGSFNAFGHYYRFAAAEAASDEFRSRAISYVLAGGVVAAFTGPNLAKVSRQLLEAEFAGIYLCIALIYVGTLCVVQALRLKHAGPGHSETESISVRDILRRPFFLISVATAMVGYGAMNLLMTATPLAMMQSGFHFDQAANVIQWHVVGMFAPAFFTGHLITRFGALQVMAFGSLALIGSCAINLAGTDYWHFLVSLCVLGVGWNFCFVGATSLVTEDQTARGKVQGLNDLLVFSTVGITAVISGQLHHRLGWEAINFAVLPVALLLLVVLLWSWPRSVVQEPGRRRAGEG